MKSTRRLSLNTLAVGVVSSLFIVFCGAFSVMAYQSTSSSPNNQIVKLNTRLAQSKVLKGSDGNVSMELIVSAEDILDSDTVYDQPVDLVVVLDRSGSMGGKKIHDAREAILRVMDRLSRADRFALITYANNVFTHSSLLPMNHANYSRMSREVANIRAGGGTNLGGGLQQGVGLLRSNSADGRQRKLILLSDGLANHGITDPMRLGAIASNGIEYNFSVSTVGVGYDFNELLMTTIADHGGGNYYFLENPEYFASVFEKEFDSARKVAATSLEIHIELHRGVKLVDGGGYPIKMVGNTAIIRPGDLLSGQKRSFFLTYSLPTNREGQVDIGNLNLQYKHKGQKQSFTDSHVYTIQCVDNREEVLTSVDKEVWSEKVIKDDYNKMREQVADAIRSGNKEEALYTISEYEQKNRKINETVGSAAISENLDSDVSSLKKDVEKTFSGAPAAVQMKQKQQSKALQYESYRIRRDKK